MNALIRTADLTGRTVGLHVASEVLATATRDSQIEPVGVLHSELLYRVSDVEDLLSGSRK